jgi:hypothetical protein
MDNKFRSGRGRSQEIRRGILLNIHIPNDSGRVTLHRQIVTSEI